MAAIDSPPPGSGNWPLHHAAALHLAGLTDGRDLLPWLRGENGWYHNGKETGSPLYEDANAAVALQLHHGAANPEVRAAARLWLRALWARMALAAASRPRAMKICIGGRCQERSIKQRDWIYHGPWSYRPGERALRNPAAGGWGVHWDVDPLQPTFGAALDLPRTFHNKRAVPAAHRVTLPTLLPWVLQEAGIQLEGANPAARFGLSEEERSILAAFVTAPSATAAHRVAPYLEGYGEPRELIIARFANDALVSFWSDWSRNANKPAAVMVARRPSGQAVYGVPSLWRGVGAQAARAEWDRKGNRLVGHSRDSVPPTVLDLQAFGSPNLVLRLTTEGLEVTGASSTVKVVP